MDNKRMLGKSYEKLAADYLIKQGYTIKCMNYQVRQGEIDIIAYDNMDDTLCFVEVKYRKNSASGSPLEAVGRAKQKQVCKAAIYYMNQMGINPDTIYIRFDVIGIDGEDEIIHIKDAFSYIR